MALAIAVVGPTATGKTALAVALAQRLGDAELVNADSRQVLRGLRIGVNAPTARELKGVPCHLIGIVDPGQDFTVADWLTAAQPCVDDIDRRGRRPVVVGGTGLYISALLDGFDLAGVPPDPRRRSQRTAQAATPAGLAELAEDVTRRDPRGAAGLDLRNPRRLVRALEILDARGTLQGGRRGPGRRALWIGIDVEPSLHRGWIADRAARMLTEGLVEEIAAALDRGVSRSALERAGIGYREGLNLLDGRCTEAAAQTEIIRRTMRYAKAQRTWFRRDRRIHWLGLQPGTAPGDLAARALSLVR